MSDSERATNPKKSVNKNVILVIIVALIIFGAGVGVGKHLYEDSSSSSSARRSAVSEQERAEQNKERLDERYQQLKERIIRAEEAERITKEQAGSALKKAEEVYNSVKDLNLADPEVRSELRKKREEIQQWASENDISSIYTLRAY